MILNDKNSTGFRKERNDEGEEMRYFIRKDESAEPRFDGKSDGYDRLGEPRWEMDLYVYRWSGRSKMIDELADAA